MNPKNVAACAALIFASFAADAATWVSLGRLNALTAYPNTVDCQYRIVNNYWSSKPIYTPTVINVYSPTNIEFRFPVDLSSLRNLTSNSTSLSRFKTALDFYNTVTTAKSIWGSVSIGTYTSVSTQVSYADAQGLVQGRGWGVDSTELKYYELQEFCAL